MRDILRGRRRQRLSEDQVTAIWFAVIALSATAIGVATEIILHLGH